MAAPKAQTDTDPKAKATLARLVKLIAAGRELQQKLGSILDECDELLGGGVSVGDKLKRLETAFDRAWGIRYAGGETGRYVWAFVKDKPQLKRLLKTLDVDEIERRMIDYIALDDPFLTRNRHTFGLFVSRINTLAHEAAAFDPPAGCLHSPPCRDDAQHTTRQMAEDRQ